MDFYKKHKKTIWTILFVGFWVFVYSEKIYNKNKKISELENTIAAHNMYSTKTELISNYKYETAKALKFYKTFNDSLHINFNIVDKNTQNDQKNFLQFKVNTFTKLKKRINFVNGELRINDSNNKTIANFPLDINHFRMNDSSFYTLTIYLDTYSEPIKNKIAQTDIDSLTAKWDVKLVTFQDGSGYILD